MATLLTIADVRTHVETDLTDPALTRLNDDADATVIERFGPLDTDTEQFFVNSGDYPNGRDKFINLSRKPANVTSITEQFFDNAATVLSADDYELVGSQLRRLDTGTNPGTVWGHVVNVVFVPYDTTKTRKVVIIDLIKLEVEYRGLSSEAAGDYKMSAPKYHDEKEAILKRLAPRLGFA